MTLEQLNMLKLVAEQGSLKKPVNLYIKLNRLLAKDKTIRTAIKLPCT